MLWRRSIDNPYAGWDLRHPFSEFDKMRREMNRFAELMKKSTPFSAFRSGVFPALNLTEDKDKYYVRAELPGLKSDELEIQIVGKGLSIAGERKLYEAGESVKYHRREREGGKFARIINLPGDVDANKVEAKLQNGILTVVIPKTEAAKPRQIIIK